MPAEVKVLMGGVLTDTYSAGHTVSPAQDATNESQHRNNRKLMVKEPYAATSPAA